MKHKNKILALLISVMTIVIMSTLAHAGSNVGGTASATEVQIGDTFTMTVQMDENTISSIGTAVSVDSNLEIVSAKWLKNGLIAAYDATKNKGAFTPGGAQAISGDIFEVTLKAKTATDKATVTVEVIAKNGSQVVFTEATSVTVKIVCTQHSFGKYENAGNNHTHKCTACGYTESAAHSWDNGVVTKEPTCSETGTKTFTCKDCSATKTSSVNKTQHNYSKWTQDNDKQHSQTCTNCSDVITENHTWDKGTVTKEATCAEQGSKTYKCTKCSATKTETIEKTQTHSYGKWTYIDDNAHAQICTVCNNKVLDNHQWDKGTVSVKPSCSQNGIKTFTCATCKHTKTEILSLTEHVFTNDCDTTCNACDHVRTIKHNYDSKWYTTSDTHEHRCTVCGEPADVARHSESNWIVDVQPTDKTAGKQHKECTVCKYVIIEEVLPATGCKHDRGTSISNIKEATCTEPGYTGDTVCNLCKSVIIEGKETAKAEHDTMLVNASEATCTQTGYTGDLVCVNCNAVITKGEVVDKKEHAETATINAYAPTCTQKGMTGTTYCVDCDEIIKESEEIPMIEHDYKDGKCTVCGAEGDTTSTEPTTSAEPNTSSEPSEDESGNTTSEDISNESTTSEESNTSEDETIPKPGDFAWIWVVIAAAAFGISLGLYLRQRHARDA